jgi:uncharacterized protein
MNTVEHPVSMHGAAHSMLGVVTLPGQDSVARTTGLVIVVGGAQSRAGSHRQNVLLARHLASHGFPVLRFDLPGLGDSPGEPMPFEHTASCIRTAVDTLLEHAPGAQSVCLWGLCDGASASLLYLSEAPDSRVKGLGLLNPWVRSDASLARTYVKHYYRDRLLSAEFWQKLLRGGVGVAALRDLGRNLVRARKTAPNPSSYQDRMAQVWLGFSGHMLLMLSELDLTAREFLEYANADPQWAGWDRQPRLTVEQLTGADHTCSSPEATRALETRLAHWLESVDR